MSKKVLVFFSFKSHKKGYIEMLFKRLSGRADRHGLQLFRGALKELQIRITDGKLYVVESLTGQDIADFDDVYFELWYKAPQQALAAAKYLETHGKQYFSREISTIMPDTKVGELAALADYGLSLPDTFSSSRIETKRVFKKPSGRRPFDYPFVMKSATGYGGNDNYLIHSFSELTSVLNANKHLTFVCQQFIPNDCDYRLIVLGGKVRFVLKRSRVDETTHLNNTSKGAEGVSVPVDFLAPDILRAAEKAAEILNRSEFAGVDILIDKHTGQYYILEVNQTPQIEIGAEVEQKMDALLSYINERTR